MGTATIQTAETQAPPYGRKSLRPLFDGAVYYTGNHLETDMEGLTRLIVATQQGVLGDIPDSIKPILARAHVKSGVFGLDCPQTYNMLIGDMGGVNRQAPEHSAGGWLHACYELTPEGAERVKSIWDDDVSAKEFLQKCGQYLMGFADTVLQA
jgi:hypothetical protein